MWVKVCANTSLEDAQMAVDAGADAVGFVFAESARRVSVAQVAGIAPLLPASVEKIGVFVEADFDALAAAIEACGLTGVQLHTASDPAIAARLRERYAREQLRILRVIHFQQGLEAELREAEADTAIDGVLVDSRTATMLGGTGIQFDWKAARVSFAGVRLRLIAAGGLNPENVAEAISTLQPWGVDVASGVEERPGKKDSAKVKAFVENARVADSLSRQSLRVATPAGGGNKVRV
ncbi:MAG TPA: phosphoribosylanthranilate isomerase [Acidobacteriaceae bacterium]|nr:phosphoribosylanthranilate isomerase [Acidobacteriaceae bacterium]